MPPVPRGGGRRRRMTSIRNPSASPSVAGSPAPQPPPQPAAQTKPKRCACPPGEEQPYRDDEGVYCSNCGTRLQDLTLTSEVTFGESASGAAVVQGTTLQQGQRHTHIAGLGYRNQAPADDEQKHENAMRIGSQEIRRMTNMLHIPEVYEKAVSFYHLARINHLQRPLAENAAIAIYAACREQPTNTTLLIDLAEIIRVNVYDLGSAYKKFLVKIDYADPLSANKPNGQKIIEIEPLIYKFAKRLEFDIHTRQVANDASAILARMDRDWMITGRQPMGLIGACLIIAARMNNFRRTLREVVYVVRAGEVTILKRLNEFSNTAAARLTVDQFRKLKNDAVMDASVKESLPPSLLAPPKKKKRKFSNSADDETEATSTRHSSVALSEMSETSVAPELRIDKDGFYIPSVPNRTQPQAAADAGSSVRSRDQDSTREVEDGAEDDAPKRKRGRPRKQPLPEVIVTEEDLQAEEAIEKDIVGQIERIEGDRSMEEERGPGWFKAKQLADSIRAQERKASTWDHDSVSYDTIINEDEFEDDPEVAFCLLTEREAIVKEKIWVSHNHDWLRQQQEKTFREELDKAKGKKKRQGPRQKMSRRGDGSVLGDTPVSSAADASSRMLEKRATRVAFSKNVNYDQLQKIYQGDTWDLYNESETASIDSGSSRSRNGSVGSASPSPAQARLRRMSDMSATATGSSRGMKNPPAQTSATRDAPIEVEDDEEDEEDDFEEGQEELPTFGDEEEVEARHEEDVDEMEEAASFGIDTGDSRF